jgi:hypothetical protein
LPDDHDRAHGGDRESKVHRMMGNGVFTPGDG